MTWTDRARWIGLALALGGIAVLPVGVLVYWLYDPRIAVWLLVGGLLTGLVGATLLLIGADTLPPGERPDR